MSKSKSSQKNFIYFFNSSFKLSLLLKLKMEGELGTQELKYSMEITTHQRMENTFHYENYEG